MRSDDCTHCPFPDFSRSSSAVMIPSAAKRPAEMSAIAVQVLEVRAVARAAHRVAFDARRRFDLDDVGAEIRELAHAGRPGANARKIEDAKARKRGGGGNVGHERAGTGMTSTV